MIKNMKQRIFLWGMLALATSFLVGCGSDETVPAAQHSQYTTFRSSGGALTRAHYMLNHTKGTGATVSWQPDDHLWLYLSEDLRLKDIGNNITTLTPQANFYFPSGYERNSYKVDFLGHTANTDGRYININAQHYQNVPNNTDHMRYNGDCAEGTATKVAGQDNLYEVAFTHLPAYLCIMPYNSDDVVRTGAVIKNVKVLSNNPIRGRFDVGQYGLDVNHGTNLANDIEVVLNNPNGFPMDNATMDQAKNAVYVVMLPGWHDLTIEFYYTSPKFPGQTLCARRNIGNREYKANSMTDIVADIANYYGANNEYITVGDEVSLAKKQGTVQVYEDKTWNSMLNQ